MNEYKSEKDTPAYRLFHSFFDVSIPAAFVRTESDQAMFGYLSTGDAVHDNQNAHGHVKVMRTIPTLAELLDLEVEINVVRPEKQIPIMEALIREHIDSLLTIYNSTQNQTFVEQEFDTPELREDIECLERFLCWLLKRPREVLPTDKISTDLGAKLKSFAVLGKHRNAEPPISIPASNAPDSFKARLTLAGRTRIQKWQ